uniref:Uncharacterized protein n=1 Tax=Rhodnius prolixus TaxID=13249 RepID=T1I3B9_RHOPR
MCSPKKLTINLAIESIDSLKKRASMIKNIECPTKRSRDPCVKQSQVIPAPIRRIVKKQIEICKCPTVEFVCPPVPCVCPPCPICPTPAERLKSYLKTGLKLTALYVMVNFMSDEFTPKHQEIRSWKIKARKIRRLPEKRLLLGVQSVLFFGSFRWTVDQHLWGTADHTSNLTNYYVSIVNAILHGEQENSELKAVSDLFNCGLYFFH